MPPTWMLLSENKVVLGLGLTGSCVPNVFRVSELLRPMVACQALRHRAIIVVLGNAFLSRPNGSIGAAMEPECLPIHLSLDQHVSRDCSRRRFRQTSFIHHHELRRSPQNRHWSRKIQPFHRVVSTPFCRARVDFWGPN